LTYILKVDCVVTTAGGVEEDFIKCLAPTYLGDFHLKGAELRKQGTVNYIVDDTCLIIGYLSGLNRIGNLLVPNNNYCMFEDWIMPIFDQMLEEQKRDVCIAISLVSMLMRPLGHYLDSIDCDPSIRQRDQQRRVCLLLGVQGTSHSTIIGMSPHSLHQNDIPVFCPALTDGSIGDMLYLHTFKNPGLVIDIVQDIRKINSMTVFAKRTGVIILGGGLVKHHICNANLMRNGANHAVYINTAQEV
jgi:deoxyhypusine synthase